MTVKSVDLRDGAPVAKAPAASANHIVAIAVWFIGAAATYQVVELLWGGVWYGMLAAALVAQGLLTWLEGPTLRGKPNPISLFFLLLDGGVNAGGVYLILADRLERLPTSRMVADAVGAAPDFSPVAVMAVSLVAGLIIAATPEAVWRWRG